MTRLRLIEQVEGEATLLLEQEASGRVREATILFPHFRGMERLLERREALDALVLTPRVCGICGHAHLMATVAALEGCYEAAGMPLPISQKARTIRAVTLALEMVQNHLKWFYLTLLPAVPEWPRDTADGALLAAHRGATRCGQAIALLAGQWPHTSYALPGGVMCDPTHLEILQAREAIAEVARLFERRVTGMTPEALAALEDPDALEEAGDLGALLAHLEARGWSRLGQSHDRFAVLAEHLLGPSGRARRTRVGGLSLEGVEEEPPRSVSGQSNHAKGVRYRGEYYEVGPLARAMVARTALVRRLHRRYRDGLATRVAARMREAAALVAAASEALGGLDLSEPSYLPPPHSLADLGAVSATGVVEAARGSLMHTVHLRKGRIARYCIVTPTQWNLAGGRPETPAVAQKALLGLEASLVPMIFKSFDVCSVCTTQ